VVAEDTRAKQRGSVLAQSSMEQALRWMATRKHVRPLDLIIHAIDDPLSDSAAQLAPLVAPTMSIPDGTTETRALAVWGLLIHGIHKVGSADSRQRSTLHAAFRLPHPEITEAWRSTLQGRFRQLITLSAIFGDPSPSTTSPMHRAWKRAVDENLAPMLREQVDVLAVNGSRWAMYVETARATESMVEQGSQPVYLELFITTVIMKGRAIHRRITERLVTARADNVDGYLATAIAGWHGNETHVPVRPLWGCRAEPQSGERYLTKLVFPRTLHRDERHYFASESIDENLEHEREWVNVEVDHHGIAAGRLLDGCVPVRGLAIRIRFDGTELPEACWWYAEQTERERRIRPPEGDPHLLPVVGNTVEHTFLEKCYPQESYGLSFWWSPEQSNKSNVTTLIEEPLSHGEGDNNGDAFEFDVVISFAGADRAVASEINTVLTTAGYRVFYDLEQQHRLLGEDLAEYLHDLYLRRSRYAIVVVSVNFLRSKWAGNWEWRAMLARMQSQREPYVLPYLIDEVRLPGLNPTIGFVSLERFRPREFAQLVVRKLRTRC
jgi:hypothetical protein